MGSNGYASLSLLLSLNLLFLTLVSATNCPPPPKPKPSPCPPPPKPKLSPCPPPPKSTLPSPKPKPTPSPTPSSKNTCPIDTLKLGVCGNLLGGLVHVVVGTSSNTPCCRLLQGVTDLDAALCLCTALKANVLGINLNVPISISVLLNACGKKASGFKCA